jgi:hypothetical protein
VSDALRTGRAARRRESPRLRSISSRSVLRRILLLAAGALAAGTAAAPLSAQQVEREVQVPLDPERGIVEVDLRLREELGLFPEVQGFDSARLFRGAAGQLVLEITSFDQGALVRERRRLTDGQLAELRADIQQRLAAAGRERVVDRSGRAGLILGQTVVGLAYHGWVVPVALDVDSDRGAVASYLLTSGASFLLPYLITRNVAVSVPQRDALFWGATRGILYGLALGYVVAPDDAQIDDFGDGDNQDERVRLALGSAGSVAGSLLGFHGARYFGADDGTVAHGSAVADFGLAAALGTSYALGLFDQEEVVECPLGGPCVVHREGSNRDGWALTLGLGLVSLGGAKLWADAEDYTVGDARALRSFGLLGAQALLPVVEGLVETEDAGDEAEQAIAASAVAGAAVGLFVGNRVLRRTSLSGGDGLLVLAGHVAGGLAALGLTYLLDDSEDIDDTVYLATSAAGSAIGSLLTFRAVRGGGPDASGDASRRPARGSRLAAAEVTITPQGALPALLGARVRRDGGAAATAARLVGAPVLTIRF